MTDDPHAGCKDDSEANEPTAPCPKHDRPWVLAATILGSSLAFITSSVVNVALPAIQTALDASAADMQWVINGYLLFLGGWLVDAGSWQWVFFVVVPFALVCLGITLWRVPESREPDATAVDSGGAALAILGLGALVYGLIAAGEASWMAPRVLLALAGGGVGSAVCAGLTIPVPLGTSSSPSR